MTTNFGVETGLPADYPTYDTLQDRFPAAYAKGYADYKNGTYGADLIRRANNSLDNIRAFWAFVHPSPEQFNEYAEARAYLKGIEIALDEALHPPSVPSRIHRWMEWMTRH